MSLKNWFYLFFCNIFNNWRKTDKFLSNRARWFLMYNCFLHDYGPSYHKQVISWQYETVWDLEKFWKVGPKRRFFFPSQSLLWRVKTRIKRKSVLPIGTQSCYVMNIVVFKTRQMHGEPTKHINSFKETTQNRAICYRLLLSRLSKARRQDSNENFFSSTELQIRASNWYNILNKTFGTWCTRL